ncbi:MAG TPA: protein-S-isoprenylcysteine O-methyltransferase [Terriglobales bacterium]|nr:protein-S-isoprenylcysteine O-methyltransferase [Terriglobales bacterium]
MNPWAGKIAFLAGLAMFFLIRAPHNKRSKETKVSESRKSLLERTLMSSMTLAGFVLPMIFILTPLLSFADHPLPPLAFSAGIVCYALGTWLFYRAHADLGTSWSPTLELRENHQLVVRGIYRSIRHPMYTAIFLGVFAQALVLPNWIAGPSALAAFTLMFTLRLRREERMLIEKFGEPYQDYMARTRRLIPGIW